MISWTCRKRTTNSPLLFQWVSCPQLGWHVSANLTSSLRICRSFSPRATRFCNGARNVCRTARYRYRLPFRDPKYRNPSSSKEKRFRSSYSNGNRFIASVAFGMATERMIACGSHVVAFAYRANPIRNTGKTNVAQSDTIPTSNGAFTVAKDTASEPRDASNTASSASSRWNWCATRWTICPCWRGTLCRRFARRQSIRTGFGWTKVDLTGIRWFLGQFRWNCPLSNDSATWSEKE